MQPNFPGILISSRRRSWATFFPKIISPSPPPPPRPPSVSNQWNCSIPFSKRGQVTKGFRGCWVRIYDPFGWNPIGGLRTNRNSFFEKSLNRNGIVAETVPEGFLGAARSNLMSICLGIVSVQLEPISDKQFNPFRPAIRKNAVPPLRENVPIWKYLAGKVSTLCLVQKAVGQPLVHWRSLLKLLEKSLSYDNLSICLSVFKRDQNLTGFEQCRAQFTIGILSSNRNCERKFKRIIYVVVPYFDRSTYFPELPANCFCSGAPQRGAHYWSGFTTYCRVQYLFFTYMSRLNEIFPGNAGYLC